MIEWRTNIYRYLDPRCIKAGEGDFNRSVLKFILLMTVIIIINLKYYFFFFFFLFFLYSNKDNMVQDNKVQGLMHKLTILIITRTTAM